MAMLVLGDNCTRNITYLAEPSLNLVRLTQLKLQLKLSPGGTAGSGLLTLGFASV